MIYRFFPLELERPQKRRFNFVSLTPIPPPPSTNIATLVQLSSRALSMTMGGLVTTGP